MDEIKWLQEQLQAVQLESTLQKLSESNVVEIVSKLRALGLVTVIHTQDGKEYLTPQQLEREVRDGIYIHQGRVNVTTLQEEIGVDLRHVDDVVQRLVRSEPNLHLVTGDVIDDGYLDQMAEQINEDLQAKGHLTIAAICHKFNLPVDFVLQVVGARLGTLIHGRHNSDDRGYLYTRAFLDGQRALVRGVLTGVTRPTPLVPLIHQYNLHEKNFFVTLRELTTSGRLPGVVRGTHKNPTYIPHIFVRTQQAWANKFLDENGYIGFDQLRAIEISDVERFCRGREGVLLEGCFVGRSVLVRVDALCEEALAHDGYCDFMELLHIPISSTDAAHLIPHLSCVRQNPTLQVVAETIIVAPALVDRCKELFAPILRAKATQATTKGLNAAQSDDSSKRGPKKPFKRLQKGKVTEEEDEPQPSKDSCVLSRNEISDVLGTHLPSMPSALVDHLAVSLQQPLQAHYQELVQSVFASETVTRQRQHTELQEQFNSVLDTSRLFQKGISLVKGDPGRLNKHFLKTLGNDLTAILFRYVAHDNFVEVDASTLRTPEGREPTLNQLPALAQTALKRVEQALGGESAAGLLQEVEAAAGQCQVPIKKSDKKRDRVFVAGHRKGLERDLEAASQPAAALHMAVMLLFQRHTGALISAPAACVPQLVTTLKEQMSESEHGQLVEYQRLIMRSVTLAQPGKSDPAQMAATVSALNDMLPTVKALGLRSGPSEPASGRVLHEERSLTEG